MTKGRRRAGWRVYPGGVNYPARRQARRVARIAGGQSGRVEGPRGCLPWLLVLLGVLAVVAYVWVAGMQGSS